MSTYSQITVILDLPSMNAKLGWMIPNNIKGTELTKIVIGIAANRLNGSGANTKQMKKKTEIVAIVMYLKVCSFLILFLAFGSLS